MKSDRVLIIAEAGVNHNGDINKAKLLIDAAAESGADYVKFQTFKTNKIVTKSAQKAQYQNINTGNEDSQYEMIQKLELSEDNHIDLMNYCKTKNINFLSTGFDLESLAFLKSLGLKLAKIPSGEITNLPYLRTISKLFPEIILSTGMANMDEIKAAFKVLLENGTKQENITILHCNTEYPTPMEDVNLKAMFDIQKQLNTKIGYSDHTLGIEVPIAAVALGAKVIEKHFTLDRNLPGPDHKASLEPEELKAMVTSIRNIEMAISGSGIKEPSPSEAKNKSIARKSIIASQNIKKGEVFSEENLTIKRPGIGISPMKWDEVIGKVADKEYMEEDIIEEI
ncbi:N-acetylneuraminate synthase [Gillisia limnaea]|uniref:N-acetylneuraminate synthase n=1 Tax=Gillisia limnaea (strain DSM 15749 / LMG 21470 / R-8282) TaxID=865937 RepID=H2BS82_GILLR|nr:N-acetylneuraminate synthase [Gillisia limnaea]EHQ01405.1 N-acetylneuraminate synthase [Gillisia limnaea DSM 15749]